MCIPGTRSLLSKLGCGCDISRKWQAQATGGGPGLLLLPPSPPFPPPVPPPVGGGEAKLQCGGLENSLLLPAPFLSEPQPQPETKLALWSQEEESWQPGALSTLRAV